MRNLMIACLCTLAVCRLSPAFAQDADAPAAREIGADEDIDDRRRPWNLHGQFTEVGQMHPAVSSPYRSSNSLYPGAEVKETGDFTIYAGLHLWEGAAMYADPEIDQGYGLTGTLGMAGFPSGEAYKVGHQHPYFRLPRAFFRQVIGTGTDPATTKLEDDANQLADRVPVDNVTFTVGKFSVVDVFDTNRYAHDPRGDFLNWSVIDAGAFDYAADAWGFTYGAAAEWTQAWWTLRLGVFALSKVPNSPDIDGAFKQFSFNAELEERHALGSFPGKLKLLAFDNRGRMGSYGAAIDQGLQSHAVPVTGNVRRFDSRPGGALNIEQQLSADLGGFLRLSANDGKQETFEFTDINKSLSAGLSLQGRGWDRVDDTAGLALVVNGLSSAAVRYFAAGGIGLLIGDGGLDYGLEKILETYYCWRPAEHVALTGDFQFVAHPGYNSSHGAVPVFGVRLHAEF